MRRWRNELAIPTPKQAPYKEPMDRKRTRTIFALRLGISGGLLAFLIIQGPNLDASKLLPDWNRWTPFWLFGAFALTALSLVLGAIRWRQVTEALRLDIPLRGILSHFIAGQFVSNVMPTTIGGDVLRVTRLGGDTGNHPAAFASVIFERLSGWLVLPVFTFLGLMLNTPLASLGASSVTAIGLACITLATFGGLLYVVGHNATGRWLEGRTGVGRYFNAMHLALEALKAQPRAAARLLVASFGYQLSVLLAVGCATEAMGIDEVGFTALMAFFPAVLMLQVLPLGIGGLGVREASLVFFLTAIGAPEEQAFSLGLLIGLLILLCSLPGLPAVLLGNRLFGRRNVKEDPPERDEERAEALV